jgi:hypothetical protein
MKTAHDATQRSANVNAWLSKGDQKGFFSVLGSALFLRKHVIGDSVPRIMNADEEQKKRSRGDRK